MPTSATWAKGQALDRVRADARSRIPSRTVSGPLSSHRSSPARSRDFPADRPDPLRDLLTLPGVGESVGATRRAVDAVIGHRVLRQRSAEVSAESALRGAWASAVLEGSEATLDEVRTGFQEALAAEADGAGATGGAAGSEAGGAGGGEPGGPIMGPLLRSEGGALADPLVQGALRVSAGLGALAETWPRAPRQALARLHVLAAADLVEAKDQAAVLGRPNAGTASGESAARLDALASLVTPGGTGAPAGVLAAIVQGELLSLRPFGTADGIVARAAARLTFVDRGLDPKSLIAFEVGQLQLRDELPEALEGYRSGTAAGVGGWLVLCGRAYELGAQETLAICEAIERG